MEQEIDPQQEVYFYIALILFVILLGVFVLQHLNTQQQQKMKVVKKLVKA
jgi:hypothetical protein